MGHLQQQHYEYKLGGSLSIDHPTYIEREADRQLLKQLKRGEFCFVINARQMGKSSLRIRTMKRLQEEGFACVSLDLTSFGTSMPQKDWYESILEELLTKLQQEDNNLDLDLKRDISWNQNIVSCLSKFTNKILDRITTDKIFIFLDEIDCVRGLNFNYADLFLFLQYYYNQKQQNQSPSQDKSLVFALFGNVHPSDLVRRYQVKFNIGRSIPLEGFKFNEITPLTRGLKNKVENPEQILQLVLDWTNGQPLLTQKVCHLIQQAELDGPIDKQWIDDLVQRKIIDRWERNDSPEHLRTIRNQLLQNDRFVRKKLAIYRTILQTDGVEADRSQEQTGLLLSGLVLKNNQSIQVFNQIYQTIFNLNWVQAKLDDLRPYAEKLASWLGSQRQDRSHLLIGQDLEESLDWKTGKSLPQDDNDFFTESRILDERAKTRLRYFRENGFDYEQMMKAIMSWTYGKESLINKIFELIFNYNRDLETDTTAIGESDWLKKLIHSAIIDNSLTLNKEEHKFLMEAKVSNQQEVNIISEQNKKDAIEILNKLIDSNKFPNPQLPIENILKWASLQRSLINAIVAILLNNESEVEHPENIDLIVQQSIIENWRINKASEHLVEISNSLTNNPNYDPYLLLTSYQHILLQNSKRETDGSLTIEQKELESLGLIIQTSDGKIKVSNLIYEKVFNRDWVKQELENLKPYQEKLKKWLESNRQNKSVLLLEEELTQALDWRDGKIVDKEDDYFLAASQIENHFLQNTYLQ